MDEIKEINIKLMKGRLIPGTDKNYFITVAEDVDAFDLPCLQNEDIPENEKIHCADCRKPVEKFIRIVWPNETKPGVQYKNVCNACCEANYAIRSRLQNINTGMSNCV